MQKLEAFRFLFKARSVCEFVYTSYARFSPTLLLDFSKISWNNPFDIELFIFYIQRTFAVWLDQVVSKAWCGIIDNRTGFTCILICTVWRSLLLIYADWPTTLGSVGVCIVRMRLLHIPMTLFKLEARSTCAIGFYLNCLLGPITYIRPSCMIVTVLFCIFKVTALWDFWVFYMAYLYWFER